MTLRDYILRWQVVCDKNQSRPTTYAAHGYLFKNHILPGLGGIPLSELTVERVGNFLEERKRFGGHRPESPEYPGLGEHTMRHIHRLLQQCLDAGWPDNGQSRPSISLSEAQEGQRQCADTLRSGGLLGHFRAAMTWQNYEDYLTHETSKRMDESGKTTEKELQQAADLLDGLLKF